jgi:hypothetical protein
VYCIDLFHELVYSHSTFEQWIPQLCSASVTEPSEIDFKHEKSQVRSQDFVKATQALLFDQEIGNTLWRDAICKRLKNERLH